MDFTETPVESTEGPNEWGSGGPFPLSDLEERQVLFAALDSFRY
jgi:hypothetical protein